LSKVRWGGVRQSLLCAASSIAKDQEKKEEGGMT
jgi:hypothetical protein